MVWAEGTDSRARIMWCPALAAPLNLSVGTRRLLRVWLEMERLLSVNELPHPLLYASIAYVARVAFGSWWLLQRRDGSKNCHDFWLARTFSGSRDRPLISFSRERSGMIGSCSTALGEEIGWRGFLVPEFGKNSPASLNRID